MQVLPGPGPWYLGVTKPFLLTDTTVPYPFLERLTWFQTSVVSLKYAPGSGAQLIRHESPRGAGCETRISGQSRTRGSFSLPILHLTGFSCTTAASKAVI